MACNLCDHDVDDFKEILPGIYQCPLCSEYWEVTTETENNLPYGFVHSFTVPWNPSVPPVPAEIDDEEEKQDTGKKVQKRLGWDLERIKKEKGIK